MATRQYPRKADISTTERLKLVATFVMRGWSANRIARELDYDTRTAQKDVLAVRNRTTEIADLDSHLRDISERTKEKLNELSELKAAAWRNLDWAQEWVPQVGEFNAVLREPTETGEPGPIVYGPRKPHLVTQYMKQISELAKQESELLGLLDKSVDVTVKLEQNMRIQAIVVDILQEIKDPSLYAEVRRRIAAVRATSESSQQVALPAAHDDVIDAEYADA